MPPKLMGVAPPPEIPFETAQLSPMARSFYGENKRVSNAAIKEAGYRFRFSRLPLGASTACGPTAIGAVTATADAASPINPS